MVSKFVQLVYCALALPIRKLLPVLNIYFPTVRPTSKAIRVPYSQSFIFENICWNDDKHNRGGSFSQKIESANPAKLSGLTPGISSRSVESAVS